MKKASKILTLILVVVFLFGIFAGCDLIGKNTQKYRETVVINVGKEEITIGKLLDTFNSYYNNYYYYISYGYITVDELLDMALDSLYTQYMKVDHYVKNHDAVTDDKSYNHSEYLTKSQLDYSISYVRYLILDSFDDTVMERVEAKYELGDEEAEDTSRDFYEYDDLKGAATYAEYYFNKSFSNEDMDEYVEKYLGNDASLLYDRKLSIEELYKKTAEAKVAELNKRIDEEAEQIKVEDYQDMQEAVVKQYATSVKDNYGISFEKFVDTQINDMIISAIVNLYNYEVYRGIENPDNMNEILKGHYDTMQAAKKAEYAVNDNFESFIEGLSDSSIIYDVPTEYANSYVFVKNILIPFSAKQTRWLNNLSADLGTEDNDLYTGYRNFLATKIVADDFNTEKDDDGEYGKVENLFDLDGEGNVVIKEGSVLANYLKSDGSVTAMEGKTAQETVIELMKQFNTDTAQHSALYSYVVRVDDPKDYTHKWVDEFVQATKDAMEAAKKADAQSDGTGYYGIAVSNYGVHIVYVEGFVKALSPDFKGNYLDTTGDEYKLFKNYFETQQQKLLSENLKALKKDYVDRNEITAADVFKKFLKENGINYDMEQKLKGDD